MNILRRGNDDGDMAPPVRKAKVECTSCGSVLEVTLEEVHEDDCGAFHHSHCDASVNCAVCKSIVPINSKQLTWYK